MVDDLENGAAGEPRHVLIDPAVGAFDLGHVFDAVAAAAFFIDQPGPLVLRGLRLGFGGGLFALRLDFRQLGGGGGGFVFAALRGGGEGDGGEGQQGNDARRGKT